MCDDVIDSEHAFQYTYTPVADLGGSVGSTEPPFGFLNDIHKQLHCGHYASCY